MLLLFPEEDYILLHIDDQNYKNKYEVIWVPEKSESREGISLTQNNPKTIYPIQL